MVEVDIFWSYAIGAGFAAAAARQLKDEEQTTPNPYFLKTMIYLSTLFAPSGIMLLWAFTGWETMYVWNRDTLPAWLVPLFAITNVTQGILGFWITHKLIKSGKFFWANMQWVFGYFAMFFILVHGWDGTGYRRFFTWNPTGAAGWTLENGVKGSAVLTQGFAPWVALKWAVSPVALTLYAMGIVMLPLMFYWIGKWATEGYRTGYLVDRERASRITTGNVVSAVCKIVFVDTLGAVIVYSILIHLLGALIASIIFVPAFAFFGCGPSGILRKHINAITLLPEEGATGISPVAVPAGK